MLFHLRFELTRPPAGVSDKSANGFGILINPRARFVEPDVVIEFYAIALFPLEGGEHQLIFPNRTTKENRNIPETRRCFVRYQISDVFIQRTIENDAERAFFGTVI